MRTRLLTAGLSLGVFFATAIGVGSKLGVSSVDEALRAILSVPTNSWLHALAGRITDWGVAGVLLPLSVVLGVLVFRRTRNLPVAAIPALVVQGTSLLVREAKRHYMVARPRASTLGALARNPAFPSGHAAVTTAFVVVMAGVLWPTLSTPRARLGLGVAATVCALVMGWTRLALEVHWFSDVVGGWALGLCTASIGIVAARFLDARGTPGSTD